MIIAGFDFGTSGVKLVITESSGIVLARGSANYDTVTRPGGIAEQVAEDWWQAAKAALAETGIADTIDAIGITGQMQDLIPVADTHSVRAVLLYSDTRATAETERLRNELPDWEQIAGNHQDASNVVAKIAWMAENEPENLAHATTLLLGAPGYIGWRATGVAACDVLTASTTGLLDVINRDWYYAAVTAAGARPEQLPILVGQIAGDELIGHISDSAASDWGVRAGIPIVLATGDAGAATDGMLGSEPGSAYIYLGTTGWLAAVRPAPSLSASASAGASASASASSDGAADVSPIHSLVMPGWANRLRIGAVQSAGHASDWARRTFLAGKDFAEIEKLIADRVCDPEAIAVRPLCLPGIAGERTPVRDMDFRGAFVGVHESTTPVDFYLSVLTGVAMGLRHAADEMGFTQNRIALVGGAASSQAWRTILADVFNATIITRATDDPGTYSAVRVAAHALGEKDALLPLFDLDGDLVETKPSAAQPLYAEAIATHRELYTALAPTFHHLVRHN